MATQNDFYTPIDISGLTSVTAAQFLSMLLQLTPLDNIGGVICMSGASSAHPDVTNNARFIRYVWLDTQTAGSVLIKVYQGVYPSDLYADWVTIAVADGSITAAKLANYSVSILNGSAAAKIAYKQDASADATKSSYILRLDAAGQFVEVASLATMVNALIILPAKLDVSTASDGYLLQYRAVDGFPTWQPVSIAGLISAGSLTPDRLINGTVSYILRANPATGIAEYASNDDSVSTLFPVHSIALTKLAASGAVNLDTVRFDGASWVKKTPFYGSLGTTLPVADGANSVAHGLGSTPRKFGAYAICNSNDAATGYQTGDVIDANSILTSASFVKLITVWANATLVGISMDFTTTTRLVPKAGGAGVAPTSAANFDMYAWAEL